MDALKEITASNVDRSFDHTFANIPIFDTSSKEDNVEWLERLETACLQTGYDIRTETISRTGVRMFYGLVS